MTRIKIGDRFRIFIIFMVLKTVLEYTFYPIIVLRLSCFSYEPDFIRWINGTIWCMILYWCIDNHKRASSFLLYLMYMLQIIPITVYYEASGGSALYYNLLCVSYLMCTLCVHRVRTINIGFADRYGYVDDSNLILMIFWGAIALVVVMSLVKYGIPELGELNLYGRYGLRSRKEYSLGHYGDRLVALTGQVFLPICVTASILKKRVFGMAVALAAQTALFLYSGEKTYVFAAVVVAVISIWSSRRSFEREFCTASVSALVVLSLAVLSVRKRWFDNVYDLLIRRVIITPAALKFDHFDYFSDHPKLGMFGVLPRRLLIKSHYYYQTVHYPFEIGRIYYHTPNMHSNTGFFSEGYSRYGFAGLIISMGIMALILLLVDSMQERTDYRTVICFFSFPFYFLAEGQLIGTLFFGRWFFLIFILLFYSQKAGGDSR